MFNRRCTSSMGPFSSELLQNCNFLGYIPGTYICLVVSINLTEKIWIKMAQNLPQIGLWTWKKMVWNFHFGPPINLIWETPGKLECLMAHHPDKKLLIPTPWTSGFRGTTCVNFSKRLVSLTKALSPGFQTNEFVPRKTRTQKNERIIYLPTSDFHRFGTRCSIIEGLFLIFQPVIFSKNMWVWEGE